MSHTPSASSPLFRLLRRLLVLLVLVYFGLGALIALEVAKPVRRFDASKTAALQPLGLQEIHFPARGGDKQLAGWYVPHAAGRHAVILVHGMSSSRTAEYRGQFSDLVGVMYRSGFAVLSLDLRGHGQSDDGRLSFSINEHRDVLGAYDYLRAQGYGPRHIGALGISMGGASVLVAAAREPGIGAVVSDSAFAEISSVLHKSFQRRTGMPTFLLTPAALWTRLLLGYDLLGARPVDEVAKLAPRPLLIIHGDADQTVPLRHAHDLKSAYPSAELWIIPGGEHATSFSDHTAEYTALVSSFFQKSLEN